MTIEPERVKALFLAAIERDEPADRRAFLDGAVGDDAELRDRLAALLAAYDQPPGALDRPLAADPEATVAPDATPSVSSPPAVGIGGEGPIQGTGRPVVGGQQGGEPVAQLGVVADLAVEERPAVGRVATLDGRQEQGLDSLGIGRHARASARGGFPT